MQPFVTVLADPPWAYDQALKMSDGVRRSSASQYATMSVDAIGDLYKSSQVLHLERGRRGAYEQRPGELAGFPIADVAFLWLWVTNPFLLDGSGVRVCRAWGFEPKQIVPWVKGRLTLEVNRDTPQYPFEYPKLVLNTGMGHITRGVTEHLIVATRGKYSSLVKVRNEHGLILAPEESCILAPRSAHSKKPPAQYAMIERVCPGPYLELFARERRAGWTSFGNELPPVVDPVVFDQAHGLPPRAVEAIEWP